MLLGKKVTLLNLGDRLFIHLYGMNSSIRKVIHSSNSQRTAKIHNRAYLT